MTLIKTMPESTFKIFAPMLKASLDSDGKMRLHGIASSTVLDRQGHTITASALGDMETSASNNMTIFLNHEYKVPEDVAGSVERASIRSHPTDPSIKDLVLDIVVNEANPRAVNAWQAIQKGTQLGLSIGAQIPEGGAHRDKKSGAYVIEHVALLETSLVGVPANPRSWVEYAVKSLNGSAPDSVIEDSDLELTRKLVDALDSDEAKSDALREPKPIPGELVVGEPIEQHELTGQDDGNPASEGKDVPVRQPNEKKDVEPDITAAKKPADHQHPHAHEHDHAHDHWNGISHSHEHAHTHSHAHDDSHEHVDDKQGSEHDHSHMDSYGNNEHPHEESTKGLEPDVTMNGDELAEHLTAYAVPYIEPVDGTVAIAASQEAPESAPENEDGVTASDLTGQPDAAEVESALLALEPTVIASLRTSSDLLKAITRELIDTKAALGEVTAERDQAMEATAMVLTNMDSILKGLSKTPVGRRAVFRESSDTFTSLKSVYSEEFLTLLKKGK
jgi:HK97 family phage prohead protease